MATYPNIYLIGPQCAGKTTLLKQLNSHFTMLHEQKPTQEVPKVIEEVVRKVMQDHQISTKDSASEKWYQLQIFTLKAQFEAEETFAGQWFISDRSAIDPMIYTRMMGYPVKALTQSAEWGACHRRMMGSVVILCEAGNSEWFNFDAVRQHHEMEEWISQNKLFEDILNEMGVAFHRLTAEMHNLDDRVDFVLQKLAASVEPQTWKAARSREKRVSDRAEAAMRWTHDRLATPRDARHTIIRP